MRVLVNKDIFDGLPPIAGLAHMNLTMAESEELLNIIEVSSPRKDDFAKKVFNDAWLRYHHSGPNEPIEIFTGVSADFSTSEGSIILPGVILEFDKYDLWRSVLSTDRILIKLYTSKNPTGIPDLMIVINPFELYEELPMKNSVEEHANNIWLVCMVKNGTFYTKCRENAVRFVRMNPY